MKGKRIRPSGSLRSSRLLPSCRGRALNRQGLASTQLGGPDSTLVVERGPASKFDLEGFMENDGN